MEDYQAEDNGLTNNAITLLEKELVEHQRLKVERILDVPFCRTIDYLSSQINNAILLIRKNARFDWVAIQNEIDECYTKDKNATGVAIYLDWKDCEKSEEQRIFIKGNIGKAN